MSRLKNLLCAGGALTGAACGAWAQERPNVIYVFPDQFRNCSLGFWNDAEYASKVGFAADPVHTPNLDRFASQAVVLTEATSTCPVSSPHRGMLLSGMYPERNGVILNCMTERPESSLRADAECISDVFSKAGYNCAYLGKLHVDFPTPNDPQRPGHYVLDQMPVWDAYTPCERRHGFDYWYSYGTYDVHKNPHYWDTEGQRHEVNEWSVSHEIAKAIDYLDNKQGERDAQKPFFMMLGLNPPHSPYNSVDDCDTESYNTLYKGKTPDELLVRPNADRAMDKARSAQYYFANVSGIDREFGRLMQRLEELGLADNTIVVFTSDHGETMCSHGIKDAKNVIYREAFNVPFLIRYPQGLAHRVDNLLLSTTDIMPTLLSLAGLGQAIPASVEGRDLSAQLRGERAGRPTSALYMLNTNGKRDKATKKVTGFFPQARGIKTDRYTLKLEIDRQQKLAETLLFDDRRDPYQMHPLDPSKHRKVYAQLCRALAEELARTDDVWYRERILASELPYTD